MNTIIEKLDGQNKIHALEKAADLIKNGSVVAFPTETVYGLGANGLDEEACKKIFDVKRRKRDNPLILHVTNDEMVKNLSSEITEDQKKLMDNLWPGPLTIIFKKSDKVNDVVSCGGNTVAIRNPSDEIARFLIDKSNCPIAAPSANKSGRPSPTNAQDVYSDMQGEIELILDGGSCNIGIESTVVDLTEKPYTILRPGFYTKEDLQEYLDEVVYDKSLIDSNTIPKSPGQKYKHYAPKTKLIVIKGNMDNIQNYVDGLGINTDEIGFILCEETATNVNFENVKIISKRNDYLNFAHNIFSYLRELDKLNYKLLICEGVNEQKMGISIMNRLKKSCANNIELI